MKVCFFFIIHSKKKQNRIRKDQDKIDCLSLFPPHLKSNEMKSNKDFQLLLKLFEKEIRFPSRRDIHLQSIFLLQNNIDFLKRWNLSFLNMSRNKFVSNQMELMKNFQMKDSIHRPMKHHRDDTNDYFHFEIQKQFLSNSIRCHIETKCCPTCWNISW